MRYLKKDAAMLTKKLEKSGDDSVEAREDLEMDIGEVNRRMGENKSVSMSVKKASPSKKPKKSAKAKKYDFCFQYPISQHRGYNNASGNVYMNCGLNQFKGAVKIDNSRLPEPEYEMPKPSNVNKKSSIRVSIQIRSPKVQRKKSVPKVCSSKAVVYSVHKT